MDLLHHCLPCWRGCGSLVKFPLAEKGKTQPLFLSGLIPTGYKRKNTTPFLWRTQEESPLWEMIMEQILLQGAGITLPCTGRVQLGKPLRKHLQSFPLTASCEVKRCFSPEEGRAAPSSLLPQLQQQDSDTCRFVSTRCAPACTQQCGSSSMGAALSSAAHHLRILNVH